MPRSFDRLLRALPVTAAIVLVLYVYLFFGSFGRLEFRRIQWDQDFVRPAEGYYASLTEGFLHRQLSMAHRPDPLLLAMPHPYDYEAREGVPYLWDASYFNGKYYLYFTPLPALIFYLPFRLVSGAYPPDQLAGTVFAAWAFLLAAAFVRRALALANPTLHVPVPVWILMLGLANVIPFVLSFCRAYEVAILCGAAMTSTWMYALLRLMESPSTSRLVWTGIWLGLAIAARPNMVMALLVLITAIVMIRKRGLTVKAVLIAAVPLAVIGGGLALYNYARFHDPLQFGEDYQLTYMPMSEHQVCGLGSVPELLRLINSSCHYVFWAPVIRGDFPFVDLLPGRLDPRVSFADEGGQVAGLAPLAPLAIIGSLFAAVLALRRDEKNSALRAAFLVLAAGWLTLFGLSTCWFVSARYELDFWMPITAGGIVCLEAGLALLASAGVSVRPLRVASIVVACFSALIGLLLGFKGTQGQFAVVNPELVRRLSELFN